MPVGAPKPKRWIQWFMRFAPTFAPIRSAPMLEDWARILDREGVRRPRLGVGHRPVGVVELGRQVEERVGGDLASSSAPATVNALNVDPGS